MEITQARGTPVLTERTPRMDDRPADRVEWFDASVASRIDASYRLATIILGDPVEAEDATHDAVVTAWRRLDDLRDPALFDRWFGRIVVNTCRDRLRRRHRWWAALPSLVRPDPGDPIDRADDRDRIGRAFRSLSPDDRIILGLRHFADLPLAEIAERLGLPVGTAKSRLHRATTALRRALADPGADR
jgi:RNA polymerase sigma-70 factor (ECF subfamily)